MKIQYFGNRKMAEWDAEGCMAQISYREDDANDEKLFWEIVDVLKEEGWDAKDFFENYGIWHISDYEVYEELKEDYKKAKTIAKKRLEK